MTAVAVAQTGFNGVITFINDGSAGSRTRSSSTTKGHKVRLDGFGGIRVA